MSAREAEFLNERPVAAGRGGRRREQMFERVLGTLPRGQITMDLPSGRTRVLREKPGTTEALGGEKMHATWQLKSYRALRRIFRSKSVGFAESYMEGEWDTPDLAGLLELLACNMDALEARLGESKIVAAWNRVRHLLRSNTKSGSRRNIAYHYDLGNAFYATWLDEGMTYSAALFDEDRIDLASAQANKYRRLAEELELSNEHRVLEIGCGWGGFAEFAARQYGCRLTCLTLSREQYDYASARIERAGLGDRVEIRLQDYRDVTGEFDRIVSIEMFEAVGEEHWPKYFQKIRDCLKPGGRAGFQIITIADERYQDYRNEPDFIQKYIFPGGMLPSPQKLAQEIAAAGLTRTHGYAFGESYAKTLKLWRREFLRSWKTIARLGYSEKFRRMWEYYLCYCEAGFRRGTIDVGHYFVSNKRRTHE